MHEARAGDNSMHITQEWADSRVGHSTIRQVVHNNLSQPTHGAGTSSDLLNHRKCGNWGLRLLHQIEVCKLLGELSLAHG